MVILNNIKLDLLPRDTLKKGGIDYKKRPFSSVSKKDSLRIILSLVAYYDFELHQMDVKIVFLKVDLA